MARRTAGGLSTHSRCLPVGAYGGRRDLIERVAPLGPVYQAGALSGIPSPWRPASPPSNSSGVPARTNASSSTRLDLKPVSATPPVPPVCPTPVTASAPCSPVSCPAAGRRLHLGQDRRHRPLRPHLSPPATPGRLLRPLAVRGWVRLAGPFRTGHRPDDPRRAGSVRGQLKVPSARGVVGARPNPVVVPNNGIHRLVVWLLFCIAWLVSASQMAQGVVVGPLAFVGTVGSVAAPIRGWPADLIGRNRQHARVSDSGT